MIGLKAAMAAPAWAKYGLSDAMSPVRESIQSTHNKSYPYHNVISCRMQDAGYF